MLTVPAISLVKMTRAGKLLQNQRRKWLRTTEDGEERALTRKRKQPLVLVGAAIDAQFGRRWISCPCKLNETLEKSGELHKRKTERPENCCRPAGSANGPSCFYPQECWTRSTSGGALKSWTTAGWNLNTAFTSREKNQFEKNYNRKIQEVRQATGGSGKKRKQPRLDENWLLLCVV